MDLHASGERTLDVVQGRLDAFRQLEGVDVRLFLDADDDRGARVVGAFAPLDRRAFAHDTDIPDEHWRAAGARHEHAADGVESGEASDATHQIFLPFGHLEAGRRIPIR
jgi:hypothetical protein